MGASGALQARGWRWGFGHFGGEVRRWCWELLTGFALGVAEVGKVFQCTAGGGGQGSQHQGCYRWDDAPDDSGATVVGRTMLHVIVGVPTARGRERKRIVGSIWNRSVHRSNRRFKQSNSDLIASRSNWSNWTGTVTGRRSNQPVRSCF